MDFLSIISMVSELFNDAPQIITGLLVFPPLLYLVKRLSGNRPGWSHFKPSSDDLYSYRNNFMLAMFNVFTWTALFVVFDKYLINFWEDTFGISRLNPFGSWPLVLSLIHI